MKNTFLIILIIIVGLSSCQDPYIGSNSLNQDEQIITDTIVPNLDITVPDTITPEESENDPQATGVACDSSNKRKIFTELIGIIEIPADLPETHDLSENMPPVRSQGKQGSCVAWATTYYLKSYQEKIQNEYDYLSYENVMSPAFVYNQSKVNPNCNSGSAIQSALEVLKEQGVNSWKDFPYSDDQCAALPTDKLLLVAKENKIKEYFQVGIPDTIVPVNYTLINLVKTLVYQKNPIVISMDFENLVFENEIEGFIANNYSTNPIDSTCGHAILIVGYNDTLNAFKIVNSWGTSWGNEGYAWVNYDFFLPDKNTNFQEGLTGAFIAYDDD
tara:strand:+ start:402 stop:1391 length:990 start_codon:yes stop_codon:yes gene_type:complete